MQNERRLMRFLASAYDQCDVASIRSAIPRLLLEPRKNSRNAAWHPLGFFRIELGTDDASRRYMIHCWPRGDLRRTQSPAWLLHCHIWHLESVVLLGSLCDTQYVAAAPSETARSGPLYRAQKLREMSLLSRTDEKIDLAAEVEIQVSTGTFYEVGIERFHETHVPLSEMCVTLVRVGDELRAAAKVLGDADGPQTLRYQMATVERELITNHIRRL
jgi:hypothetical protein